MIRRHLLLAVMALAMTTIVSRFGMLGVCDIAPSVSHFYGLYSCAPRWKSTPLAIIENMSTHEQKTFYSNWRGLISAADVRRFCKAECAIVRLYDHIGHDDMVGGESSDSV